MKVKRTQWSYKDVLRGKTFSVIVVAIIFNYIIKGFADKMLTYFINMNNNNETIFQYNYSFENLGLLFFIPSALLSIWVIKKVIEIKGIIPPKSAQDSSLDNLENEDNQKKQFKWYSFYGVILGYLILPKIIKFLSGGLGYIMNTNIYNGHPLLIAIIYMGSVISSFILLIMGVKSINKIMIEVTHTNELLINDIKQGKYNSNFSDYEKKEQTIKLLETGRVSSVNGALKYMQLQKVVRAIGKASKFIALIIFFVTFGTMNFLLSPTSSSGTGSNYNYGFSSNSKNDDKKKKIKKEAEWNARQKQKEADHAWKYAGKQARYNANTHYMTEKLNGAKQKQKEANAAKDYSKKL